MVYKDKCRDKYKEEFQVEGQDNGQEVCHQQPIGKFKLRDKIRRSLALIRRGPSHTKDFINVTNCCSV